MSFTQVGPSNFKTFPKVHQLWASVLSWTLDLGWGKILTQPIQTKLIAKRHGTWKRSRVVLSECTSSNWMSTVIIVTALGPQNPWKMKVLNPQYMGYNPLKWRFWVPMVVFYCNHSRQSVQSRRYLFSIPKVPLFLKVFSPKNKA